MANCPAGSDKELNNPINDTDDQTIPTEQCYYCNEEVEIWHRDKYKNIICPECVQEELENNSKFIFT